MIRILAIDDHELVRQGFCRLLASEPDMLVVAQASSFEEALPLLRGCAPDVVTLDLELPGVGGREAALEIAREFPCTSILVVSYRSQPAEVRFLREMGVLGYVAKAAPPAELILAVRSVAHGQPYLSSQVAAAVTRTQPSASNPLTCRQTQVIVRMARGMTTREIAQDLGLRPKTVEKYRSAILQRLDARNQVEALHAARSLGVLEG